MNHKHQNHLQSRCCGLESLCTGAVSVGQYIDLDFSLANKHCPDSSITGDTKCAAADAVGEESCGKLVKATSADTMVVGELCSVNCCGIWIRLTGLS